MPDKSPWTLSWFRQQGFDCDFDNSFTAIEESLLKRPATGHVQKDIREQAPDTRLASQRSPSQQDLHIQSLEHSQVAQSSGSSDSDESQLELIYETLKRLATPSASMQLQKNSAVPSTAPSAIHSAVLSKQQPSLLQSATKHLSGSITASVREASDILQSIDRSMAIVSAAPSGSNTESPSLASSMANTMSAIRNSKCNVLERSAVDPMFSTQRSNLILGELLLLRREITFTKAELQRMHKTVSAIPYTKQRRRAYLIEQCIATSERLDALRHQWDLILAEQTTQLNELKRSIVYYDIHAEAKITLP